MWEQNTLKRLSKNRGPFLLSADALGITVCLYAYSNLSFSGPDAFADVCFDHYHWLREYMLEHPEVGEILGATD